MFLDLRILKELRVRFADLRIVKELADFGLSGLKICVVAELGRSSAAPVQRREKG